MAAEDLEARWELVAPHREHLIAIAVRRCPSQQDAEDCAHEAMVRAVAYPALDPARVGPLLTAMVVRVSADMARRRGTEWRGRARLAIVPEQAPTPDEAIVDSDEARWLRAQVSRLPERERQVFEHRAAGFSATETANTLRLSYKAVESAFTRARNRLRLWAVSGAILLGNLVRRARQRPAVITAMLAMSAGCLLGSHPASPGHEPPPGTAAHAGSRSEVAATVDMDGLPGGAPPAPRGLGHGGGAATAHPARVTRPGAGAAPSPTPNISWHSGPVKNPTGGNNPPITDGLGISLDFHGSPASHYEYCAVHPNLGPSEYGCPQT